ncbi:MAG: hypothetical protein Q8908_13295 [Bacteroidota bacterium]|nr:hypothetical protein [Bacteroidota bacterium]
MSFPVNFVNIEIQSQRVERIDAPLFALPHLEVKEDDFFLDARNIACYRAQNGHKISLYPYPEADPNSVNLFLNGSVLGAILHQRGILPFHGSSFVYKGQGIIICGVSGAGKSSVTAAFCQQGGQFLTDDITPVNVIDKESKIIPIKTRLKLWDNSVQQLSIENQALERIRPMLDKFYLPNFESELTEQRLDQIIILNTHNKEGFEHTELSGVEKYNALRLQIYRKNFLKGMPETAKRYFGQLLRLASQVKVSQVARPQICNICETLEFIQKEVL